MVNVSEVIYMKRAKRDRVQRAYKQGYKQGLKNHSSEACPYTLSTPERGEWMAGWRLGHASYTAGYRMPDLL